MIGGRFGFKLGVGFGVGFGVGGEDGGESVRGGGVGGFCEAAPGATDFLPGDKAGREANAKFFDGDAVADGGEEVTEFMDND